jgi:crotonobetainyl-CoA:carnitine CoA-transferase CaiB-like acyl-CoA transferase
VNEPTGARPAGSRRTGPGPLEGVRVLDLSRFIAGPLCAQILGDMGAEVIKVERPGGEDARAQGPTHRAASLYAMAYNRNKLGVTLDTRHPAASSILGRLVEVSDVLVENYRPGTLETIGLGVDRRAAANGNLIVTSLSGFGQSGPLAQQALFDPIAQAMSGLMSLTGSPDGPPTLVGTYVADHVAALYGAIGTLLALRARDHGAGGQVVDVASLDALFSTLGTRPLAAAMLGEDATRSGSRDQFSAPANVFATKDGHVYIHAGTDSLFPRLCAAIDRRDVAADTRFGSVAGRLAAVAELEAAIDAWTRHRSTGEVLAALRDAGIPAGAVARVSDAIENDQLVAREMLVRIDHPILGELVVTGLPIKLGRTPGSIRKAPPLPGEDNERVYGELLHMSTAEIDGLRATGAI